MPALKPFLAHIWPRIRNLSSLGSSRTKKSGMLSDHSTSANTTPNTSLHRERKHTADDTYLELGDTWKNEVSVMTKPAPDYESGPKSSGQDTAAESYGRDGIVKTVGVKVAAN